MVKGVFQNKGGADEESDGWRGGCLYKVTTGKFRRGGHKNAK